MHNIFDELHVSGVHERWHKIVSSASDTHEGLEATQSLCLDVP